MKYKGTFNISGQNVLLYTHANSLLQAKRFFMHQMGSMFNIPLKRLSDIFNGEKDNFLIIKEE